jgi:endonuclease G
VGTSPSTVKLWFLAYLFAFGPPSHAAETFSACPQFFAHGIAPEVKDRPLQRALCYDAFAILHSGESKTPVFVAERLNRAAIADTGEKRSNRFYAEARLRSAERATLEDYKGSGFDRGHMAPAGDMPTAQAMVQSFSLANMVPQAPEHNRGVWAKSVESSTRKYASRAVGDVYVITGPVYVPSIVLSPGIGPGQVRVPKYLFKLVYDEQKHKAWAYWHENANATPASAPISYAELVKRTGISFLPDAQVTGLTSAQRPCFRAKSSHALGIPTRAWQVHITDAHVRPSAAALPCQIS